MNDYLNQIRQGEPVTIIGKTPNLGSAIFVTLASLVATGLAAWVLYQELPVTAWAAVICVLHLPSIWLRRRHDRKFDAIHLGPEGLRTRGVLASWSSVARIDAEWTIPRCIAYLHPGSTVKFASTKQELQLRSEVIRYHGIPLETKDQYLRMSQIVDLCMAAKRQWGGESYQ
ncbi:hypothetical protein CKALI_11135 [Corynebacterium kalinowskii]|uniref:Uncharacterized protein n=1 Tax=Corynebacterium kalinowskii TaxID=2675216 RepID=A0A6B8VG16_9CORY|nr:hypothetical protein [Corynebacterium kalinowskii]QGU03073.1 hypothetical protein CKALI_11135 [Corynebacterium kalinowskii]